MCIYYTGYITTNLINGKKYAGVHKTTDLEDGYLGSGRDLRKAIKEHGKEHFQKSIVGIFETANAMWAWEKEFVTQSIVDDPEWYNVVLGGLGIYGGHFSPFSNPEKYDEEFHHQILIKRKEGLARAKQEGKLGRKFTLEEGIMGRTKALTTKARQKRIESFKRIGHSQGAKNSQFGTCWITNGTKNKKILKTEPCPSGWHYGRVCK